MFLWINLQEGDFKFIGSNFGLIDDGGEYFLKDYEYIKFTKGQNNIVAALFSKQLLNVQTFAFKEFKQLRIEEGTIL